MLQNGRSNRSHWILPVGTNQSSNENQGSSWVMGHHTYHGKLIIINTGYKTLHTKEKKKGN
jgi:hypothetical protein